MLRAGSEPLQTELGFSRLAPGRTYRVVQTGQTVTAGLDGTARLSFDLAARSELDLVPVA